VPASAVAVVVVHKAGRGIAAAGTHVQPGGVVSAAAAVASVATVSAEIGRRLQSRSCSKLLRSPLHKKPAQSGSGGPTERPVTAGRSVPRVRRARSGIPKPRSLGVKSCLWRRKRLSVHGNLMVRAARLRQLAGLLTMCRRSFAVHQGP
jgi:hypothetical protein